MAKRLHAKHIIPGFLYANARDPTKPRMVTKVEDGQCEVYDLVAQQYRWVLAKAIVIGFHKGNFIYLGSEEYR